MRIGDGRVAEAAAAEARLAAGAWRDLRGGVRGLRIVLACLALGVAAIAAVGSLRAAVDRGLATEGRRLLGGDIAIEGGAQPLPPALRTWLEARGGRISAIVLMRSLLVAASGERQLIELKVVDPAYPLVGVPVLDPAMPLAQALGGGLVADPLVLQRLRLHPGDIVRLGEASFVLRAALDQRARSRERPGDPRSTGDDRAGRPGAAPGWCSRAPC